MNLTAGIQKKIGNYVLKKHLKLKSHKALVCNIKEAKSIGILYDATHVFSFEAVRDLTNELSNKTKKIKVLGYVDSKQMIDHYLYRKGFEFFTRNHLNWYNKPESDAVNEFINQEFDILLDLNLEHIYPNIYILAFSKAKFKTGVYSKGQELLDFMIDIEKEKTSMKNLQLELAKDTQKIKDHRTSYDNIADIKTETELQLNFLINQLVHYLSQIKK